MASAIGPGKGRRFENVQGLWTHVLLFAQVRTLGGSSRAGIHQFGPARRQTVAGRCLCWSPRISSPCPWTWIWDAIGRLWKSSPMPLRWQPPSCRGDQRRDWQSLLHIRTCLFLWGVDRWTHVSWSWFTEVIEYSRTPEAEIFSQGRFIWEQRHCVQNIYVGGIHVLASADPHGLLPRSI